MLTRVIKWLLLAATTLTVGHSAFAQNILVNGDFETNPPTTCGNHLSWSIAPWVLGSGNLANVVTVDQGMTCQYGSQGPQVDATSPGPGIPQHYLDIADGHNDFYQSFTPRCSGTVHFGGFFSTRSNLTGTASITIRQGVGTSGPIVGATQSLTLGGGSSQSSQFDAWTPFNSSVPIVAGMTYSFVVAMDNNMNFDNGFVEYTFNCPNQPPVDPCCPPWNVDSLLNQLMLTQPGNVLGNIAYSFVNSSPYKDQIQAYIDYLHALNGGIKNIVLYWTIEDCGASGPLTSPNCTGNVIGSPEFTEWSCGVTSTNNAACQGYSTTGGGGNLTNGNGSNVFNPLQHPLPPNRWYRIRTFIYLNDGIKFWDDQQCSSVAIDLTVYAGPALAKAPNRNQIAVEVRKPGATKGDIVLLPLIRTPPIKARPN